MTRVLILTALLWGLATSAMADIRELGRSEIRDNVRTGQSLSLKQLIGTIAKRVDGDVVDVRAFKTDKVYYRVLVKQPDGRVAAAVIDAGTGRFMSPNSRVTRNVMAAAKGKSSKSASSSANASAARSEDAGSPNARSETETATADSRDNGNSTSNTKSSNQDKGNTKEKSNNSNEDKERDNNRSKDKEKDKDRDRNDDDDDDDDDDD